MQHPGREIDLNPIIHIDEYTFMISTLTPTRCFELGTQLMTLIGEPMANIINLSGDTNQFEKSLPTAVRALCINLKNPETLGLFKALFKTASPDNGKSIIDFDRFFHGRMGLMFKVLVEIIKIQFGDFFGGVAGTLKHLQSLASLAG